MPVLTLAGKILIRLNLTDAGAGSVSGLGHHKVRMDVVTGRRFDYESNCRFFSTISAARVPRIAFFSIVYRLIFLFLLSGSGQGGSVEARFRDRGSENRSKKVLARFQEILSLERTPLVFTLAALRRIG